jgi:IQ domain-containing protein G
MIAVINECIEKLHFLGAIAPDVLSHRDELTAFVGGEISRIITKQRDLESQYEKLINERGALRGLSNKTRYKEVQMEIQDVSVALRESTKSLCRNLKDNPNIAGNLSKIHRERTQLLDILTSTNAELQESGLFETLATRVTQDRTNQANQKEILRKERETAAAVKQLDEDLENERADHAQIVTEQRAEMAMLKENLLTLRTKASVDVRFQRAEANAKSASILRSFKQKETEMEKTIKELEDRLFVEKTVHAESTKFLKSKQDELKGKVEKWEHKYNEDVEGMTIKYNKLVAEREANLEVLVKLKKRREKEIADEETRVAAEEAAIEEARLAEILKKKQDEASSTIQGAVKRWLKRLAEANKGKKKGGKKGGKKGKKK